MVKYSCVRCFAVWCECSWRLYFITTVNFIRYRDAWWGHLEL